MLRFDSDRAFHHWMKRKETVRLFEPLKDRLHAPYQNPPERASVQLEQTKLSKVKHLVIWLIKIVPLINFYHICLRKFKICINSESRLRTMAFILTSRQNNFWKTISNITLRLFSIALGDQSIHWNSICIAFYILT